MAADFPVISHGLTQCLIPFAAYDPSVVKVIKDSFEILKLP